MIRFRCPQCRRVAERDASRVNRSRRVGMRVYCSRLCSGLARRTERLPESERKAKKAAYDVLYRAERVEERREQKREYHRATYDPKRARRVREERKRKNGLSYHAEYCRQRFAKRPALKRGKVMYDRARRDRLYYGPLAPAAQLLRKLETLIRSKYPSDYERRKARGYYLIGRGSQERKRDAQISRW